MYNNKFLRWNFWRNGNDSPHPPTIRYRRVRSYRRREGLKWWIWTQVLSGWPQRVRVLQIAQLSVEEDPISRQRRKIDFCLMCTDGKWHGELANINASSLNTLRVELGHVCTSMCTRSYESNIFIHIYLFNQTFCACKYPFNVNHRRRCLNSCFRNFQGGKICGSSIYLCKYKCIFQLKVIR